MLQSPIKSTLIQRFRVFWPSWKFFEDIGHQFTLEISENQERWIAAGPTCHRHLLMFIWNPQGNLRLALQSSLDHLAHDLQESNADRIQESPSYLIVKNWAAQQAQQLGFKSFSFRVLAATQGSTSYQLTLQSPLYNLSEEL